MAFEASRRAHLVALVEEVLRRVPVPPPVASLMKHRLLAFLLRVAFHLPVAYRLEVAFAEAYHLEARFVAGPRFG